MKLYDTLSGQEQEFAPVGERVRMYVCGITPYAPCHMGHAMSYVVFDVLRRYLEFLGYQMDHVQNFTDVDDKIIQRANEEGVDIGELAERNIQEFLDSMDALNVLRAHVYPRATQEIPRIIEIIDSLINSGYAYASNGDVYFRVAKVDRYGALSRRTLEGMLAGARVEVEAGERAAHGLRLVEGRQAGKSPHGIALGVLEGRAGTSSVRPCPCSIWGKLWTSMGEARTSSSPTTRTRRPRAKPTPASLPSPVSGSTTGCSGWGTTR